MKESDLNRQYDYQTSQSRIQEFEHNFVHNLTTMHKNSVLFVLVLFSLALQSILANHTLTEEERKLCLKVSKRTLKSMMKSFRACNNKLKLHHVSGEEYQKKVGCVVKCVMESVNVLDENGFMTTEKLHSTIESMVPPQAVDFAHEKLNKCITENKLDPKDENCKTYLDLGTCMQSATAEMCGEAPLM